MLLPEATICHPSDKCDILPNELVAIDEASVTLQIILAFAILPSCLPKQDDKTLLMKILHTLATGCIEINIEVNWNLPT